MERTGGTIANHTGEQQELFIEHRIKQEGYTFIDRKRFEVATKALDQKVYTKQYYVGQSIYGTELYCDFIVFDPIKYPNSLIIESKWQQASGSVDEKYPFLVLNIKMKYPAKTVLVLDGEGYKPQAKAWLCSQIDSKLIAVLNMMEFQKWANKGNL